MQLGPPGQFGSLTADVARVTGGGRARSHEERLRSDVRAFLNKGEISCVWAVSGHILHVIATATMFVLYPGVEISLRIFEPPPLSGPSADHRAAAPRGPAEGRRRHARGVFQGAAAHHLGAVPRRGDLRGMLRRRGVLAAGAVSGGLKRNTYESCGLWVRCAIVWVMGARCT